MLKIFRYILILQAVFLLVFSPVAHAIETGGYPYWNAPRCSDPQGCQIDDWQFYKRECTSFVAWKLNSANKYGFKNNHLGQHFGHASNWLAAADAAGITHNDTPAVGAVAWFSSGHVAWVSSVSSGNVTIAEYNYGYTGNYNTRTISAKSVSEYIHFKDIKSSSSWPGVAGLILKGSGTLHAGQRLNGGEYLLSDDGRYVLVMQKDGNLVVYNNNTHIWNSKTAGNPGSFVQVQSDGNFVIYDANKKPLWNTNTRDIARVVIQGDGNLVGYTSQGKASWRTGTVKSAPVEYMGSDRLVPGQRLYGDQFIRSSDRRYVALMQGDGNLVVYAPGYKVLWNSRTAGNPGAFAQLQHDGNFVVYNSSKKPLWDSKTNGTEASRLVMQNDGNFVLYPTSGSVKWASGTNGQLN